MPVIVFRRPAEFVRHLLATGWTLTEIDTSALNGSGELFTVYGWTPPMGEIVAVCPDCAQRAMIENEQLEEAREALRRAESRLTSMVRGARDAP